MSSQTDQQPVRVIKPIRRGADLTDDDLEQLVQDFYEVRNWCALKMRMGVLDLKRHCLTALQVRLGRREQKGPLAELSPRRRIVEDLRLAMTTATNDDSSKVGTEERARFVARITAMQAAIDLIEEGA